MMRNLSPEHLAMIAIPIAGIAWGIFWVPLRALDAAGISGIWAVVLFQAAPTALLLPLAVWRWRRIAAAGWPLHLSGLLAGTALVLYAGSLVYSEVVRALLFFYLTPLWSTLIARVALKEQITPLRWVTIILALAGLFFILGLDQGFDASLSAGDWMGIASGIIWALAAISIQSNRRVGSAELVMSYFFWGTLMACTLALLPIGAAAPAPSLDATLSVLPWFLPVVLVLVIPSSLALIWGATVLSPGLLAVLFMTEISAGTITAAIWAGEPFGLSQILGVILITSAGLVEPIASLRRAPA